MNKKIILYPHGGSGNHGCEAIVRSTSTIVGQDLILFSSALDQDVKYGLSDICEIRPIATPIRKNIKYLKAMLNHRFFGDIYAFDKLYFQNIIREAINSDVALSIGGDNYCYGIPEYIMLINKELRKKSIPTVLWGASIEPTVMNGRVLDDLKGYKLIVSRESLTTNALKAHGLSNVIQAPDPAFILPKSEIDLPNWWKHGNMIGINASPMILDYSADDSLTLQNYIELVNYILTCTDSDIVLIPHVVWSHNDDREPLNVILHRSIDSERVHVLDADYNAGQLKYVISNCRALITARTHASIAAYSTGIPTIVMGYSVKARGIAYDLFGKEDAYVLPVQGLKSKSELVKAYIQLIKNEDNIKSLLNSKIPEFQETVMNLGEKLINLV